LVALVERVVKVPNLGGVPDEGALDLGDGDLARLYPSEQGLDRVRRDGVRLSGHGSELASEGTVEDGGEEGVEFSSRVCVKLPQ
jgi:hypothetical protein